MIVILLAALMTAGATGYLVHPLMRDDAAARRQGFILMIILPAAALGLYLWRGNPELPSKPALYETTGIRADLRAPARQEMDLMRRLAAHPTDTHVMLALGDTRLREDHVDDALAVLAVAEQIKPDDHDINMELGAAHYIAALDALRDGNGKIVAMPHFDEALRVTPADASYRAKLIEDREKLRRLSP